MFKNFVEPHRPQKTI